MKYFLYYIIMMNLISFVIYGIDKLAAKTKRTRVSERWLFFLSFLGGSIGSLFGMMVFRHKTKKLKFYIWNILCFLIWAYLAFNYIFVRS